MLLIELLLLLLFLINSIILFLSKSLIPLNNSRHAIPIKNISYFGLLTSIILFSFEFIELFNF